MRCWLALVTWTACTAAEDPLLAPTAEQVARAEHGCLLIGDEMGIYLECWNPRRTLSLVCIHNGDELARACASEGVGTATGTTALAPEGYHGCELRSYAEPSMRDTAIGGEAALWTAAAGTLTLRVKGRYDPKDHERPCDGTGRLLLTDVTFQSPDAAPVLLGRFDPPPLEYGDPRDWY